MPATKELADEVFQLQVFDNHCHMMDPAKAQMTPLQLAECFYHGAGDIPFGDDGEYFWGKSPRLMSSLPGLGIVQTLVHRLATRFGCDESLEAVAAERNLRTAVSYPQYINEMYDEAKIVATMVDAAGTDDDPGMQLFPGATLKTFQFDDAFDETLASCGNYDEMKRELADRLHRDHGIGRAHAVKCHLAERFGLSSPSVTEDDARGALPAAKAGDHDAMRCVYVGLMQETMLICADLDISIHFHTGMTGGIYTGPLANCDPFALAEIIRQPAYIKTKVVLLHAGHPWSQSAAALTHALPNVWMDFSWTCPWVSLRMAETFKDVLGVANHDKLLLGSGGHDTPEMAWLCSSLAKGALVEVSTSFVERDVLSAAQCLALSRKLLADNAFQLYEEPLRAQGVI